MDLVQRGPVIAVSELDEVIALQKGARSGTTSGFPNKFYTTAPKATADRLRQFGLSAAVPLVEKLPWREFANSDE